MYVRNIVSNFKQVKCLLTSVRSYRVMVVGGTSKLGQAVCMLLRNEPGITSLTVHDSSPQIHSVISDLQHIPSNSSTLVGLTNEDDLIKALVQTDIVLTTGGVSETPDMQSQNPVSANTALIQMIAYHVSKIRPMPFVGIATEPINTLMPLAAEIMQRQGKYEPRKLFGITGEDALRAQVMYGYLHMINPLQCSVPVICGHTSSTAVPLLSQAMPHRPMNANAAQEFTEKFRSLAHDIRKDDGVGPGLGTAYSVLMFTKSIIQAFDTKSRPVVNAYMENNDFGTDYFAGRMRVTPDGASDMERYTNLSEYECNLLQRSIRNLRSELCEAKKILKTEELV